MSVPNSVASSTVKAARLFAAGEASGSGAISVKVVALTEGVLIIKLKGVMLVLFVVAMVGSGAGIFCCRTAAGKPGQRGKSDASALQKEAGKSMFIG